MTGTPTIPFDQRDGHIWFDGEFVEWKSAKIHVLTHGLHYASCVYEGERVYSGNVFRLREHTDRLYRSAQILDFELPCSKDELEAATAQVIELNGIVDGYVRPVAWRGSEQISTSARASRIHVALACWSWPSYFDPAAKKRGITLETATWRRPPPSSSPFQAKASSHYMIATLCKHHAEANGFQDALMLDWRGQIAEATSANIFFVRDNELHTPTPDCFLDGITRQTVIELARERNINVIERAILPDELDSFNECFVTGTAAEVCPVSRIDQHVFTPSTTTFDLMSAYEDAVRNLQESASASSVIASGQADAEALFDAASAELALQGWTVLAPSALESGVRNALARFGAIVPQYNGEDTWDVRMKAGFEKVPYSQSLNGIGPHTEVPVGNPPPRYLALHCHRQARCGQGHTHLADGAAFCRSLDTQLQRYIHEVPVQFTATLKPGEKSRQTLSVPIMSHESGRPIFRFSYNQFRYGDVNPSEDALTDVSQQPDQTGPLARLAALAAAHFESDAQPVLIPDGHLLIWDNHRLIHARSRYSDPARHLTRYWLQSS